MRRLTPVGCSSPVCSSPVVVDNPVWLPIRGEPHSLDTGPAQEPSLRDTVAPSIKAPLADRMTG